MSTQSEKSIQELREEIQRLEDTVAQQREIIKARGDELAKRVPSVPEELRQVGRLRDQMDTLLLAVLGYKPCGVYPERFIATAVVRCKELQQQLQDVQQDRVDRKEIEALKKERDAVTMRALDAERDLRNEQFRSAAFNKRINDLESSGELVRVQESNKQLTGNIEHLNKTIAEMAIQSTRAEYEARELRKELAELKGKYAALQEVQKDREWANTNKNPYDALLSLRDMILPDVPLGDFREKLLQYVEALQRNGVLERTRSEELEKSLETARAEWSSERLLKEELYKLYEELRRLFHLEQIAATDPKKVHAGIVHMLKVRDDDITSISATLLKERVLACEEIRRLGAKIQTMTLGA